jgi:hypothetical protein
MYARLGRSDGGGEGYAFRRLGGSEELELTLWPTERAAAADPAAEYYEVSADRPGGSRDREPRIAALVWFEGPVSEPVLAAVRRANAERIGPRMESHAGSVRALDLWQPERRRMLVVVLAESVEAVEDAQRVILSMPLLPGEDPALLPGPDRVDLYQVLSVHAGSPR